MITGSKWSHMLLCADSAAAAAPSPCCAALRFALMCCAVLRCVETIRRARWAKTSSAEGVEVGPRCTAASTSGVLPISTAGAVAASGNGGSE
jgi:hypothetical protein